jgi:hypothetical protein
MPSNGEINVEAGQCGGWGVQNAVLRRGNRAKGISRVSGLSQSSQSSDHLETDPTRRSGKQRPESGGVGFDDLQFESKKSFGSAVAESHTIPIDRIAGWADDLGYVSGIVTTTNTGTYGSHLIAYFETS